MTLYKRDYGTVAGPHPRTAQAGFEMLVAGGNAIDAAVAAAFAEGVVEPSHNGIAGYGGCVHRLVCVGEMLRGADLLWFFFSVKSANLPVKGTRF